jgi:predicted enzyme related to lactoylglutathione lyase
MGYPVTWFEISAPDYERAASFYADLFGWHTENMPEANYALIDTHGRTPEHGSNGINGGIGKTQEGQGPGSTVYVEAPDIQAVLDKAESMGAKVLVPVTETMMVTFAMFADPWGNMIGVVKGDGSTKVSQGDNAPVTWFEINSPEPKKAWDFYRDLFDWKITEDAAGEFSHGSVDTDAGGKGISGGIGGSSDGQPTVTVYAQVDDLKKYLDKAEQLGAKTVVEPVAVAEDTTIAVFVDPQGVPFGLYTHQH